jgi:hypothetical protein
VSDIPRRNEAGGAGHPALNQFRRWPPSPFRVLRYAPWLLPQRGALRVRGARVLDVRGVLPFRASPLRGALRLPCGVVPRVRDALLPCDDVLRLALT